MKDQMNSKQAQAFVYVWAKRLKLKTNHTHVKGSNSRVNILTKLIKERLNLNKIEVDGLNIIVKVFDKVAYGGCGHFSRSQIEAWFMLEGANKASDFTSAIELVEELISVRAK